VKALLDVSSTAGIVSAVGAGEAAETSSVAAPSSSAPPSV